MSNKQPDTPAVGRTEGILLVAGVALGLAALLLASGQTAVLTIAGTF